MDPFCGTGTTMVAALRTGRHSIGLDIDAEYCRMAARRLKEETSTLFSTAHLVFEKTVEAPQGVVQLREEPEFYTVHRRK